MVNTHKAGLVFGALLGGVHLLWSLLVLTGLAQVILGFVFWAHMIHMPMVVGPFMLTAAIALVVFTSVVGYALGAAGAHVWNYIHRR